MRRITPIVVLLLLAACGGGTTPTSQPTTSSPTAAATPTVNCEPSGTALAIESDLISFSKACLATPAGQPFTIKFKINAAETHNIAIFDSPDANKELFKGTIETGPKTVTYNVSALPAGAYFFRCDVHPGQMRGTLFAK